MVGCRSESSHESPVTSISRAATPKEGAESLRRLVFEGGTGSSPGTARGQRERQTMNPEQILSAFATLEGPLCSPSKIIDERRLQLLSPECSSESLAH